MERLGARGSMCDKSARCVTVRLCNEALSRATMTCMRLLLLLLLLSCGGAASIALMVLLVSSAAAVLARSALRVRRAAAYSCLVRGA